ncbi:hypothetical protein PILCRDRAFT_580990 [Piloderma croceum F 1598]|uniref:Uncharacterized protein n=1 Tax=Piloderma croceum (strain F 1598) TaxID=765440 RepID=A0A0C3BNP3_PILCF|nr:hypothetical protein PILCRDRAFT_580990 [Piloderma croceum F 1598]
MRLWPICFARLYDKCRAAGVSCKYSWNILGEHDIRRSKIPAILICIVLGLSLEFMATSIAAYNKF